MKILVINCGSSSLKFQLLDMNGEIVLAKGLCDRIGLESSTLTYAAHGKKDTTPALFPTHLEAFHAVIKKLTTGETKVIDDLAEIAAVGHRVAHGGEAFLAPTQCTPDMIESLREICTLAPLHNPAAIRGMESAIESFGADTPNVAIFDTAFHSTMPPKAYMYALPYEYYTDHGVRKYGFHGTSHKYVSQAAAAHLGVPFASLKIISCHLGNGGSVTAIQNGKVVDTSMGMTPLAGIIMGTRCGDIDPSVVNYLKYTLDISGHAMDNILNKKSGLLGISGISSDMRDLEELYKEGNERATLAIDLFNYKIRERIGAYMMAMGGVDVLLFTGGIGENDAHMRQEVCADLAWFGFGIDEAANQAVASTPGDVHDITAEGSRVTTLVIATNEELMIARETKALLFPENTQQ